MIRFARTTVSLSALADRGDARGRCAYSLPLPLSPSLVPLTNFPKTDTLKTSSDLDNDDRHYMGDLEDRFHETRVGEDVYPYDIIDVPNQVPVFRNTWAEHRPERITWRDSFRTFRERLFESHEEEIRRRDRRDGYPGIY